MSISQKQVEQAELLARRVHAGQVDKLGVDYFLHVRAVADAVSHLGCSFEIAALLHDAIEDCDDADIVNLLTIGELFGPEVRDAVNRLTKRPGDQYKQEYLPRVKESAISKAVKLADIAHNQSRLQLLNDEAERARLTQKYDAATIYLNAPDR